MRIVMPTMLFSAILGSFILSSFYAAAELFALAFPVSSVQAYAGTFSGSQFPLSRRFLTTLSNHAGAQLWRGDCLSLFGDLPYEGCSYDGHGHDDHDSP